jgi:hypothetical protein
VYGSNAFRLGSYRRHHSTTPPLDDHFNACCSNGPRWHFVLLLVVVPAAIKCWMAPECSVMRLPPNQLMCRPERRNSFTTSALGLPKLIHRNSADELAPHS